VNTVFPTSRLRNHRGNAGLTTLLAFCVVAWQHAIHAVVLGHGDTLSGHLVHALRDSALAWPLAFVAVWLGRGTARQLGVPSGRVGRALIPALLVSTAFALLLIPAVAAHGLLDAALAGGAAWAAALREARDVPHVALHGVVDAAIGFVAALPLMTIAFAAATRPSRVRRPGAPARGRFLMRGIPRPALACVGLLVTVGLLWTGARAQSSSRVEFDLTDDPGPWFDTRNVIAGTRSLAIVSPGGEVRFSGRSNTVHTITSMLFPENAANMPFDTEAMKGSARVVLQTPGLYVFTCKIHPYMFGGVIVDDPATTIADPATGAAAPLLDLGRRISLLNGNPRRPGTAFVTVPTAADLALRLIRTFFIATAPANWQQYSASGPATWDPVYPAVAVRAFDAGGAPVDIPNLDAFFQTYFGEPVTLAAVVPPARPGVGQVWVDTQFELTAGKEKPGTASAVDTASWQVTRKVALPEIDMNNPHNMWTDRNQELIYQTEWFDHRLTVFRRDDGALVRRISVGESPAHVMTRVDTDQVHVTVNGADRDESVVELAPLADGVERRIDLGRPHPHAHWMSHDGGRMVTANAFTADSSNFDFAVDRAIISDVGAHPIAAGMTPDSSKYYVTNFLDSTITVIQTSTGGVLKTINLLANYDPITGAITGPVGGLPIQTPVSPDGRYMVTANTLTATITILDTATDTVVAMLPCDAGCHGVQFGARQGGGYYAYVANKFSNTMIVVEVNPDNLTSPVIAGRVLLTAAPTTARDDAIRGNAGMGGQGVLAIPVVYNGWVQNLPPVWRDQLTPQQQNPISQ
jgi:DNA-binding beta-propeller fold protein YncE